MGREERGKFVVFCAGEESGLGNLYISESAKSSQLN